MRLREANNLFKITQLISGRARIQNSGMSPVTKSKALSPAVSTVPFASQLLEYDGAFRKYLQTEGVTSSNLMCLLVFSETLSQLLPYQPDWSCLQTG